MFSVAHHHTLFGFRTLPARHIPWLIGGLITVAVASQAQMNTATAAILFAVLLASTISSIAGFAFSAICGVMLLHLIDDPVAAIRIMMICSITIQSLSVALLWRNIEWRLLARFAVGGFLGLPVGLWLLTHLSHAIGRETIGTLLICYAIYALLKRPMTFNRGGVLADMLVGFTGGVTGGLAAFPGATVTVWCGMKGWDKRKQRGVFQPFILLMQVAALLLLPLMSGHRTTGGDLWTLQTALLIPAALLGTRFGLALFDRLSDRHFLVVVNVLLLVSGIGLLA